MPVSQNTGERLHSYLSGQFELGSPRIEFVDQEKIEGDGFVFSGGRSFLECQAQKSGMLSESGFKSTSQVSLYDNVYPKDKVEEMSSVEYQEEKPGLLSESGSKSLSQVSLYDNLSSRESNKKGSPLEMGALDKLLEEMEGALSSHPPNKGTENKRKSRRVQVQFADDSRPTSQKPGERKKTVRFEEPHKSLELKNRHKLPEVPVMVTKSDCVLVNYLIETVRSYDFKALYPQLVAELRKLMGRYFISYSRDIN